MTEWGEMQEPKIIWTWPNYRAVKAVDAYTIEYADADAMGAPHWRRVAYIIKDNWMHGLLKQLETACPLDEGHPDES